MNRHRWPNWIKVVYNGIFWKKTFLISLFHTQTHALCRCNLLRSSAPLSALLACLQFSGSKLEVYVIFGASVYWAVRSPRHLVQQPDWPTPAGPTRGLNLDCVGREEGRVEQSSEWRWRGIKRLWTSRGKLLSGVNKRENRRKENKEDYSPSSAETKAMKKDKYKNLSIASLRVTGGSVVYPWIICFEGRNTPWMGCCQKLEPCGDVVLQLPLNWGRKLHKHKENKQTPHRKDRSFNALIEVLS